MIHTKLKTGLLMLLFFLLSSFAFAEDTQKEDIIKVESLKTSPELANSGKLLAPAGVESLKTSPELADSGKLLAPTGVESLKTSPELVDSVTLLAPAGIESLKTSPELAETKRNDSITSRFLARRSKRKNGKVVKIDFDDELLIKGKVLGPSLFTLYQKRNVEFGRLIQPRKDFLPEMRTTLGDIK